MRISLLLCLFYIVRFQPLMAQEIEWQNTIGGSGPDYLESVSQTSDGGYILGGHSGSDISGDKTENSPGGIDYWVVKLDSSGNISWQNTIGGNDDDYLMSISQTTDEGYILGGRSLSGISGDKTENCKGGWDYWVIKLDLAGNIQWQRTIGGNDVDQLFAISQTADGGYILGGGSNSNISGDKTENSKGFEDYWVVKLDSSGIIQWQKTIGGNGNDQLLSIALCSDGSYLLGGFSQSLISGDKTENTQGLFDFWIIKLDSSGVIIWQNTIGGNDLDYLHSIASTSDGGCILGGSSKSNISGDKSEKSQGDFDYWVIKLDFSGNIQWQNTIGGNNWDELLAVSQTTDGGYILAGWSYSDISGDKSEMAFGYGMGEYWVVKLNGSGSILWQNAIGGDTTDWLNSIWETTDGGYLLGGSSDSDISFDKAENNQGTSDFWVVKLSNRFNLIQGVDFVDLNSNNIKDPTEQSLIHHKIIESSTGRFTFTDLNGFYSLLVTDTGNFQVAPSFALNYYNSVPSIRNIYFNSILQTDSLNDFAIQPTGSFNDLCVEIIPTGNFRSGLNATYLINYSNNGTTALSATVVFYPDSNVAFVSSIPQPSFVVADSVVFSIGNLVPFQTGQVLVTILINQGLPIGSLINSGVKIFPLIGDVNPVCNQAWWEVLTTGSLDPNDILVNRDSLFDYEIANQPELEYVIRFQNTGNDTAFSVKILNPIDTSRLQLSSLEIVSSSHPAVVSWNSWERNMQFIFHNIMLPDSSANEPLSHGFIRYRIKTRQTLIAGDSIVNFAAIYFDYNDPVITNSVRTDIVLPTFINEGIGDRISVIPNPFNNELTVKLSGFPNQNIQIELRNVLGRKVKTLFSGYIYSGNYENKFYMNDLTNGVYFISIISNNSNSFKIIKL